jgi:hypothetical protein
MGSYRFNCAIQYGTKTVEYNNGEYHDRPPTAKQAITVVESVRELGKAYFPKKVHDDLNRAIDGVISWLKLREGVGYRPSGNYDITEARRTFICQGEEYRVDIKAGGKTAEGDWFL